MLSCYEEKKEVYMGVPLQYIKKGSVARFRNFYNQLTSKKLTTEQRADLLEVFQKKEKLEKHTIKTKPKKVAKPSDQDLEI